MRFAPLAVVALLAIVLLPGAGAPADEGGGEGGGAEEKPGHDVYEIRFLLLAPGLGSANGVDLRIRDVLGGEAPHGDARFFTVTAEPDPEVLVRNIAKLGSIDVLDRANLPVLGKQPALYVSRCKIPVPQVESRTQKDGPSTLVRTRFEDVGTRVTLESTPHGLGASIETSFVLDRAREHGNPIIATSNWKTYLDLAPDETAVFRSHHRILGAFRERAVHEGDEGRLPDDCSVLVVLVTRSRLP